MFEEFFNLRENPFALAPNPRFIFHSHEHAEALAHLRYWIENREGFVLITGEVGTGKTTALYDLMAQLPAEWSVAFVSNSTLTESELLEEICRRFQIDVSEHASKPRLLGQLERFLQERVELGFGSLLILDEAQNFESRVLEEVRLLSNLEQPDGKLLQIALVGQPELERKLRRPELRQLRQRIGIRYYLGPLSEEETLNYLHHRVRVAGGDPDVLFPDETAVAIHRLTHGIPREINVVASQALITAFVQEASEVRPEHLRAVVEDFAWSPVYGGDLPPPQGARVRWPRRSPAVQAPGPAPSGQLMSIQEAASSMKEAASSIREAASWIREMAPAAWKELERKAAAAADTSPAPDSAGAPAAEVKEPAPRAGQAVPPPVPEPRPSAAEPPPSAAGPRPPVAEPTAPAAEPKPPAAEPTAPAAGPTAPAAGPKPPVAEPTAPAAGRPSPAAEPRRAATPPPPAARAPLPAGAQSPRPHAGPTRDGAVSPGVPGPPTERMRRPPMMPAVQRPAAPPAGASQAGRPPATGAARPSQRPGAGTPPRARSAGRTQATTPAETPSRVPDEERQFRAKRFTFGVVEGRGQPRPALPEPLVGRGPSGERPVTPAAPPVSRTERSTVSEAGERAKSAAGEDAPWLDSLTDSPPRSRRRLAILMVIALIIIAAGVVWRWRTQALEAEPAATPPAAISRAPEAGEQGTAAVDESDGAMVRPDPEPATANGQPEDPSALVSGQGTQAGQEEDTRESPAEPNPGAPPLADPESSSRTQAGPGDFVIQVASFRGDAEIIRAERERCAIYYGLLPVTIVRVIVEDEYWNRVYVGRFRRQSDAEEALARLAREVALEGATVRQMGNERVMP